MTARGVSHVLERARRRRRKDLPRIHAQPSRPFNANNPRDVRRSLGWPSGRQWRLMRKADAREERRLAQAAVHAVR